MSNDAKKAVDAIAKKKLSDIGVETPIEGVEDLFGDPDAHYERGDKWVLRDTPQPKGKIRKTKVVRKSAPKPVTSYDDYAKQFPAIQTPHVLSREKVDKVLMQCRELPWPDDEYATYVTKDKNVLIGTLYRYFNDVAEGAGLYIKGGNERDKMMERLWRIVSDHYFHKDPHDQQYRVIREKK